jgi:hypothetical protein
LRIKYWVIADTGKESKIQDTALVDKYRREGWIMYLHR